MYELVLTKEAQAFYEKAGRSLVRRLNRCFDRLRQEPHDHPNITRLRGPLAGCFRYRIGDWRVIYEVDEDGRIVIILIIAHRSKAYK
ncbi:MAG: type II toxin-antitoxin system RelE/ParE family toxin [Anaerolineae bacterium]|jgi:mRNA interferase RelE/StbE